jgi:hypothetical protein
LTGCGFQGVHSLDVGEAYHQAVVRDVSGPFNIAADPVLDPDELGRLLGARPVPVFRERYGQPYKRAGSCGPCPPRAGLERDPQLRRAAARQ